ncbi:MAG: hypothetical protein Q9168_002233 [Polycauliona sp. 1 TL-2023]
MGGIRVVARIRPQNSSELEKDCIVSAAGSDGDANSTVVRIPSFKNANETFSFQFSSVYDQASTQQTIFDNEITPTIKHLFNGFDITIFAYGVTGTGKTHTMRGGKSLGERGIIPRLLSSTYRRCRKIEKDSNGATSVGIALSYYEIYNDRVFDLLEAPEKRTMSGLHLRDNGGKTVVVGLTERPCESLKEFEKMYDDANVNRSTSATKLNAHSSRSHAILCFKVTMTTGDEVRVSTASAIDLAGSEDNRRTDNGKERLVESASINKSLFVLAKCVEAISQNQARIPYRESKMTRILSLGQNNGLTVMILNLAPGRSYHLDTISSLNFANRTKKIEIRELENEPITKGYSRAVPTMTGLSMQRQPLRSIASTAHNSAMGAKAISKQEDKPAKMFSVYSDRPKNSTMATQGAMDTTRRSSPLKRPLEAEPSVFKQPAKRRSPHRVKRSSGTMSKETIEDMIEKKVTEKLAARAMDHSSAAPVPEISEDVQRRLEVLEKKVDDQDDERSSGLNFLLMAKQHAVRGEDKSALRMYMLARDHFPDNARLTSKIERLQSKLQRKRFTRQESAEAQDNAANGGEAAEEAQAVAGSSEKHPRMKKDDKPVNDDDYRAESEGASEEEYDSADSFRYRSKGGKKRKRTTARKMGMEEATGCPDSPRTKQLLSIINSRDVGQIRLLQGVGAKRAEAMVEALCGGEEGDDGGEDAEWAGGIMTLSDGGYAEADWAGVLSLIRRGVQDWRNCALQSREGRKELTRPALSAALLIEAHSYSWKRVLIFIVSIIHIWMDEYFNAQGQSPACGKVPELYRQHVLQDSTRLFKDNQGSIELLSWPKDAGGKCCPLRLLVKVVESDWKQHSMCARVSTRRLPLCHVFRTCNPPRGISYNDNTEIAYTYRYVINNGRTEGPRWSVRQTAVYQKMDAETGCSTWIVIQPDAFALSRFKGMCLSSSVDWEQPMAPHLAFLSATRMDWKAYMGHLRRSLQDLDEKACFSRVGKKHLGDYHVSFSDGQQLQRHRHKLFRAKLVLGGIIAVTKGCKSHCIVIDRARSCSHDRSILLELGQLISDFKYCRGVIRNLMGSSEGTAELLKQIRDFYHTEEFGRSSRALEASMVALQGIATATHDENADMLRLARHNRRDTMSLRTLTRITIIYLPASLIATIFSSNLVEFQPTGVVHQPSRLVVRNQFWIYVLATIGCTILTLIVPATLERRRSRNFP